MAVGAFKVIVNFELQRRENDRRIGLILAKTSEMMVILLQLVNRRQTQTDDADFGDRLGDVKDPSIRGLHGETIEGRLQGVMKNIAQGIHDCGNVINKYWKSNFIGWFYLRLLCPY